MPVFREVLKKRTQNGELKAMKAIFWRVIPEPVTKKGEGIILAVLIDGRYCKNLFIRENRDKVDTNVSLKEESHPYPLRRIVCRRGGGRLVLC